MQDLNEIERGQLCQSTIESLYEATGGLKHFPGLLKKVITNKAWERRVCKGRLVELSSLRELITEKPIKGWGEEPKNIEAVIRDDAEVLTMYQAAMQEKPGPKCNTLNSTNNVSTSRATKHGNSRAYTLSRLEREAPELFKRVCNKELSANAAAIEAGFRKKPTPEEECLRAFKRCEDHEAMLSLLSEYAQTAANASTRLDRRPEDKCPQRGSERL